MTTMMMMMRCSNCDVSKKQEKRVDLTEQMYEVIDDPIGYTCMILL
jgi:hypothetical protein